VRNYYERNKTWVVIGRFFFKILSALFFPVTVKGRENLPTSGGFILASNHISNLDPFLVGSFSGHMPNFVAKQSLFKNKFIGFALGSWGAFPVKRKSADLGALKESLKRLKKGMPLVVFPEGTRAAKSKRKAQPGVGFIAAKSKAPVFPVYVTGSDKTLPAGAKFFKRHPVTITYGKKIDFDPSQDYSDIASHILENIYHLAP